MSRTHSELSRKILHILQSSSYSPDQLFQRLEVEWDRKAVYDTLFRLEQQGLVERAGLDKNAVVRLSTEGEHMMLRLNPTRDGVWKIVIFDIPEKKREIRGHLRSKLKTLGFKKWQESIWISPFALDPVVEAELNALAKTLFIRLIKTTDINYTKDLEELFK